LLGLIVLERIEEEGRSLLDHILGHEDIDNSFKIDHWSSLIVDELSSEFTRLLRIDTHEMLEELSVVRGISHLLGIKDDLVELTKLGEARNNLVGDAGTEVD
jgi:hypothetical protein